MIERLKAIRSEIPAILGEIGGGMRVDTLRSRLSLPCSADEMTGIVSAMVARKEIILDGSVVSITTPQEEDHDVSKFDEVAALIAKAPISTKEIAYVAGISPHLVSNYIQRLKEAGRIKEVGKRGLVKIWADAGWEGHVQQDDVVAEPCATLDDVLDATGVSQMLVVDIEAASEFAVSAAAATTTITTSDKPPLGLLPEPLYEELKNRERAQDIADAISRYAEAGKVIPLEWAEELKRRIG